MSLLLLQQKWCEHISNEYYEFAIIINNGITYQRSLPLTLHLLFLQLVLLEILLLDMFRHLVGSIHVATQIWIFPVLILREIEQLGLVLFGRRSAVLAHGLEIKYHSVLLNRFLLLLLFLLQNWDHLLYRLKSLGVAGQFQLFDLLCKGLLGRVEADIGVLTVFFEHLFGQFDYRRKVVEVIHVSMKVIEVYRFVIHHIHAVFALQNLVIIVEKMLRNSSSALLAKILANEVFVVGERVAHVAFVEIYFLKRQLQQKNILY